MFWTLPRGRDLTAEMEVRRSRFVAVLRRVDDEADARAFVDELRHEHRDARHHCSAFILGPPPSTERSHDDGEPGGTAGAPMLEVLRRQELSDVAAVVVRWFGGTLLGTGGLARAYAEALECALAGAPLVRRERRELFDLHLPHADAGRVEAELRAQGIVVRGTDYREDVVLHLATADAESLRATIAAATAGAAAPQSTGDAWVDVRR